jgi:hypothetical protein
MKLLEFVLIFLILKEMLKKESTNQREKTLKKCTLQRKVRKVLKWLTANSSKYALGVKLVSKNNPNIFDLITNL